MFPNRYFNRRFFAARYWAKVGASLTFKPVFAMNSNKVGGWRIQQK